MPPSLKEAVKSVIPKKTPVRLVQIIDPYHYSMLIINCILQLLPKVMNTLSVTLSMKTRQALLKDVKPKIT